MLLFSALFECQDSFWYNFETVLLNEFKLQKHNSYSYNKSTQKRGECRLCKIFAKYITQFAPESRILTPSCPKFESVLPCNSSDAPQKFHNHSCSSFRFMLHEYQRFKEHLDLEEYLHLTKHKRSLIAKIRSGTLPLAIETGHYSNTPLEK